MPNHCDNTLTIKGNFEHRREFVDKNRGFSYNDKMKEREYSDLSFHASVPVPKKHINPPKKGKGDGWYNWCINNWGTKWECWEEHCSHDPIGTSYCFTTAWSPPVEWVRKVSRKFPHLEFQVEWAEEGGEGGYFMYQGGDLFYDNMMTEEQWKKAWGVEDDEE